MSLDLEVLAAVPGALRWIELQKRLPRRSLYQVGKEGADRLVGPDEPLSPPNVYRVDSTSVSIVPMTNVGNYNEDEYLADYGRNLSEKERSEIVRRWRSGGCWYGINSATRDAALLVTVAAEIAEATNGWVTVLNRYMHVPVGVYTPEAFRKVGPRM